MKKNMKRVLSLALVLLMLCSVMSISAFATSSNPTVIVYATTGMFTTGGYDPNTQTISDPTLLNVHPSTKLISGFFTGFDGTNYWFDELSMSDPDFVDFYEAIYDAPSDFSNHVNILDAVIFAMVFNGYDCYGGWDSYTSPNGGYIYNVDSYNSSYYGSSTPTYNALTLNGVNYDRYQGTGWRILVKYPGGSFQELEHYYTEYPIVDGMEIIFDYSPFDIYWPAYTPA
jgi:hypothetical protein